MIEEGSLVLHPKNQFIKQFKSVIKADKKKLNLVRMYSINQLVAKYYNEINIEDVIINLKSKIDSIMEDIYNLAVSFQERRKLREPHDIFRVKKANQQILATNVNLVISIEKMCWVFMEMDLLILKVRKMKIMFQMNKLPYP